MFFTISGCLFVTNNQIGSEQTYCSLRWNEAKYVLTPAGLLSMSCKADVGWIKISG